MSSLGLSAVGWQNTELLGMGGLRDARPRELPRRSWLRRKGKKRKGLGGGTATTMPTAAQQNKHNRALFPSGPAMGIAGDPASKSTWKPLGVLQLPPVKYSH